MQTLYVVSIPTISGKIFGRIFFSFSRLKILFDSNQIEMLLIIFLTSYFKESGLIIVALSAKDRYQCANLLIENVRK
jgi:hypothetical protein